MTILVGSCRYDAYNLFCVNNCKSPSGYIFKSGIMYIHCVHMGSFYRKENNRDIHLGFVSERFIKDNFIKYTEYKKELAIIENIFNTIMDES